MAKTAEEIVYEVNQIYKPNEGVKALAEEAWNNPDGFCIMDGDSIYSGSYRKECFDRGGLVIDLTLC